VFVYLFLVVLSAVASTVQSIAWSIWDDDIFMCRWDTKLHSRTHCTDKLLTEVAYFQWTSATCERLINTIHELIKHCGPLAPADRSYQPWQQVPVAAH